MIHYGDITKLHGAFERAGGKAVWASEIEPFCIAVTKERFGDET